MDNRLTDALAFANYRLTLQTHRKNIDARVEAMLLLNYNNSIFKDNQTPPGTRLNGYISIGDNHPPKNKIDPRAHIKSIFAYSPNQNIAYIIPEYSV